MIDPRLQKFIDRKISEGSDISEIEGALKGVGAPQDAFDEARRYFASKKKVETKPRAAASESPSTRAPRPSSSVSAGSLEEQLRAAPPVPEGTILDTPPRVSARPTIKEIPIVIDDKLPAYLQEKIDNSLATNQRNRENLDRRSPLAFEIMEDMGKDDSNPSELLRKIEAYKSINIEMEGQDLFDEQGQVNKVVFDNIENDYNFYYKKNLKDFLDYEGKPSAVSKGFVSGVVGLATFLDDWAKDVLTLPFTGLPSKDESAGDFSQTSLQKNLRERKEISQDARFRAAVHMGFSQEQIEKGGLATGLEDGQWGLFGLSLAEQIPNLVISIISLRAFKSKKLALASMAGLATGQAYADVLDDLDFSKEEKFYYSVVSGLAEYTFGKMFDTDLNSLRKTFGKSVDNTSRAKIADSIFSWIPKGRVGDAQRAIFEETLEETLVSVTEQVAGIVLGGREFNPMAVAEGAAMGAVMGGSIHALTKAPSALLSIPYVGSKVKITNKISQINELLRDPSLSETERTILSNQLGQYKSSLRSITKDSAKFYENMSEADRVETIGFNKQINEGLKLYKDTRINNVKEGALKMVKEAVDAKAAIEAKYAPAPQAEAKRKRPRIRKDETPEQFEARKQAETSVSKAGFRLKNVKVNRDNVGQVVDTVRGMLDSIEDSVFSAYGTTRDAAKRGVESVKNVVNAIQGANPDVEVIMHTTEQSFKDATGESLSRGMWVGQDGTASKVHLYAPAMVDNTGYHEAMHEVIPQTFGKDGVKSVYRSFVKAMKSDTELSVKMANFLSTYSNLDADGVYDEFVTELSAMISSGDIDVTVQKGIVQKFVEAMGTVLGKMGVDVKPTSIQMVDALAYMAESLGSGTVADDSVVSKKLGTKARRLDEARAMRKAQTPVGSRLFNDPLPEAKRIADDYFRSKFGSNRPEFSGIRSIDEARAKRISDAYVAMEDNYADPKVKKAYDAMVTETIDQYKAMLDNGYFVEINNQEPYSSAQDMINDLRNQKRMKIFSTESGFGDASITPEARSKSPLLKDSGFKDSSGQTLLVNDVFRAVHDFFGHSELGNGFGAIGEENAWNVHARMYSPEARKAMTSETRGQNSYVNFSGVNEEAFKLRDQAREARKAGDTEKAEQLVGQVYDMMSFADQKIGLLPEFAYQLDAEGSVSETDAPTAKKAQKFDIKTDGVSFKLKGTEATKAGKNIPTVQLDKGKTLDDYTISDVFKETHAPNSAVVSAALTLASGEISYKGKVIPVFYENKELAKKIKSLKSAFSAVQGTSDAAKDKKKKITAQINSLTKTIFEEAGQGMTENILALFDSASTEFLSRSKEWYVGANRIANELSSIYGISLEQSSGMLAVLSPQKPWFDNIVLAERVMNVMANEANTTVTSEIIDGAVKYNTSKKGNPSAWAEDLKKAYKKNGNVSVNDLIASNKMIEASLYLRAIDQATNPQLVLNIDPEGTFRGITKSKLKWSASSDIIKAINVYRQEGSISKMLGKGNKVRNFYNNIADPYSKNPYVTADTHAGSVALMAPMSANDVGAWGLFNQGQSSVYAMVKSAYEAAAMIAGIQPREMQSITWEIQRTGINNNGRKEAEKQVTFEEIKLLKKENTTQYEKAARIISRVRSASPQWDAGLDVQKPVSEILQGGRDNAVARSRDVFDVWRGLSRGTDTSVGSRPTVKKKAQTISSDTSSNYANLTEDGKGNFVFYHFSDQNFDAPDPNRAGGNRANVTSRDERAALSTAGPVTMFYTDVNNREGLISSDFGYEVRVPMERVYDLDADPLNLEEKARAAFKKDNPTLAFSASHRAFAMTQVAAEEGFDMTVGSWTKGLSRAHAAKKLPVSDRMVSTGKDKKNFNETFQSNPEKGWVGVSPSQAMGGVMSVYDKISAERNGQGNYDELYKMYYEYGKYSQSEITELINSSDIGAELKAEYKKALAAVPEGYRSQRVTKKAQGGDLSDTQKVSLLQQSTYDAASGKYIPPMTEKQYVAMMARVMKPEAARALYRSVVNGQAMQTSQLLDGVYENYKRFQKDQQSRAKLTWDKVVGALTNSQVDLKKLLLKHGMNNAYNLLVNRAGAGSSAKFFFSQYEKDVYKGLIKSEIETLDKVILAMRVIQIDTNADNRGTKRPQHPRGANGALFNKETAQIDLERLKNQVGAETFAKIQDRANRYFGAFRGLLGRALDAGLISPKTYEDFVQFNYQPRYFMEHVFDYDGDTQAAVGMGVGKDLIQAIKDGKDTPVIMDSRYVLAVYTNSLQNRIARNAVNREMAAAATVSFNNDWIKPLTDSGTTFGFQEVSYFEDGKRQQYQLRSDLKNQLDNVSKLSSISPSVKRWVSIATGSAPLKLMATATNALFVATNIPRDFQHILLFTNTYDNMPLPVAMFMLTIDGIRGAAIKIGSDLGITDGGVYSDWIEHGGGMEFLSVQGQANLTSKIGKTVNQTLAYLGETSEVAFRIAVYNRILNQSKADFKKKNGKDAADEDLTELKVGAVTAAREIIDFSQGGTLVKNLELISPYINAAFQGFRVSSNYVAKNPVKFAAKVGQVALGIAGLALYNMSMGGEEMEDIPEYIKSRYFVIMLPTTSVDDKGRTVRNYIKVAKAQQMQAIYTPLENVIYGYTSEMMRGKPMEYYSEGTINSAIDAFTTSYMPVNVTEGLGVFGAMVPTLNAVFTYRSNYDSFRKTMVTRDKGVVEPSMEGITDKSVPLFYKVIGQATKGLDTDDQISPIRLKAAVEKVITSPSSSLTVGIGYTILDAVSSLGALNYRGEYSSVPLRETSDPALKSLSINIMKKFAGKTNPDNKSYNRSEDIDAINMKAGSSRKEVKMIINEFVKVVKDSEATRQEKDRAKETMTKLINGVAKNNPAEIDYLRSTLINAVSKQPYDQAFNDIKYAVNDRARAEMILQIYGKLDDKDLAMLIMEMRAAAKYSMKPAVVMEYKKITK